MNAQLDPVAAPARHTPGVRQSRSRRVLLVEDDAAISRFSRAMLFESGYWVDTAADGHAGWEALHSNCYDLLITDNNMPKLTGLELVKKLRSARMSLPVIMASGSFGVDEWNRNRSLNINAIVPKPFTGDQLLATVNQVLVRFRAVGNPGEISWLLEAHQQIHPWSHGGINE